MSKTEYKQNNEFFIDIYLRNVDLYDAKKDIFSCLNAIGVNINNITINKESPSWYHPGRSGSINLGNNVLGFFGELHPSFIKKYGMRIVSFEIFPDKLPKSFKPRKNKEFKLLIFSLLEKKITIL